jgi:hypothetical protein
MDRIYFGIRMSLAMWGRLSDPLIHENSNEVWMSQRVTYLKKKPQGLEPRGFY